MRYKRTEVVSGDVYAGKDRHNGEVAAFHLSWLLGLRRVPLTVGRRLNLRQEIMPVGSSNLLKTFHQEGNNTCFYGVCYYCSPQDPVCASQDILEGALILWLPQDYTLKKFRHPWQRTYKPNMPARSHMVATIPTRFSNPPRTASTRPPTASTVDRPPLKSN
ncbi:Glycosaminoglycan xylosylkinase [Homalodisca vitripennis]|nr:Glycosaminoglycan xylosylkinase [Homalodisca vitripennis]